MYDFVTIGSALEDVAFIIKRPESHGPALFSFFEDRKIEVKHAEFHLGGGGMNTAIALSKLGLSVAPMICLGEDARSQSIESELLRQKINTELVQHTAEYPTGISVVLITKKQGRHVLFVARGANNKLEIKKKQIERVKPRWVYITSFHGNWQEDLNDVFSLKSELGFKVVLNPGQNQLSENSDFLKSLLPDIDCILLNRKEASTLTGTSSGDAAILSRTIGGLGAKTVVITEGTGGANAFDSKTLFHVDIMKVESMDTTGTGDVFGSTFAGSLHKFGGDVEKALQYAIVQSAKVTEEVGAQKGLVDLTTLEKLSHNVEITRY